MRLTVPEHLVGEVEVARRFEQCGRYVEAGEVYREAIVRHADVPLLHNGLGCALANQGRYAEAAAAFREAVRVTPLAREKGIITPSSYPEEPDQNLRAALAHLDGLTKTVVEEVEDGTLAMRIADPSAVRRKRSGPKP